MANLVKTKRALGGFSLFLIFLVPALETNFFSTPVIKKWSSESPLIWDDFQGIRPPFDRYDAEISSKIYLEYDSLNQCYGAYAGQDNIKSWVKRSVAGSVGLLKHEQYHFNLTETYARKLTKFIHDHKDLSIGSIRNKLDDLNEELEMDQYRYDKETNHGLNIDYQRYWEYKIDSCLVLFEEDKGIVTDPFSGISCFFPYRPDYVLDKDSFLLRQGYLSEKYGMKFRFLTMYDIDEDTINFEKGFISFLESRGVIHIKSHTEKRDGMLSMETECQDTSNNSIFYDRLIYARPYEYQVTVVMPLNEKDNPLYQKMKCQFFNSLDISPRQAYWIHKLQPRGPEMKEVTRDKNEKYDQEEFIIICRRSNSDYAFFYHRPFVHRQFLTVPLKTEKHPVDEIEDIVLALNNEKFFLQPPDSVDHLVRLDTAHLKPGINEIQLGYTLKADSLSSCYYLYSTILEYDF